MLNLKAFFHIHFPQKHHSLSNSYRDTKTTVNILMKKMNSFYEYKEISTGGDFLVILRVLLQNYKKTYKKCILVIGNS